MDAQQLADSLPDGVVVADAEGRVTLVSRVAVQMLGRSALDGVGRGLA
ncbi:MAG: PAS domain-containing protein, partial [Nocardioides sp.]|nr:PAS domain-containing protein [Nocardioides sp.]